MSSPVGSPDNFVDTQKIILENTTDGLIYQQALTINAIDIEHAMHFHQLTNDCVEKLFSRTNAQIEVTMMVTVPELQALFSLATQTAAENPSRNWKATLTDVSGTSQIFEGLAIISQFNIVDPGVGLATIFLRLDFVSDPAQGAQVLNT